MKRIPRFEDFEISELGNIIRVSSGKRYFPQLASKYLVIKLPDGEGKRRTFLIHRLVWETYVGEIPKGMWINHKDGNKLNNCVDNLEVVTPSQNLLHAYRELKCNRRSGANASVAILNDEAIVAIRQLSLSGWSQHKLGIAFEVSQPTIHNILSGKTWTHVEDEKVNA